jgi:acetolactate synthase-1/2/3 large subunit
MSSDPDDSDGVRGAKLLATALEDGGVEYAFGLGGSAILGMLDEIALSDISFVTTRHEHTATGMATGYAMATGRPTASLSHVGPGAANQILGIASAYRENVPVVAITGNEPSYRLGKGVRHEWDVMEIFRRFTKHNVRLDTDWPYDQLRDALTQSVTGVPGPIHVDVPRDLEEERLPPPSETQSGFRASDHVASRTSARPDRETVEWTAAMVAEAEAPLVIAGDEFRWFGGTDALASFVDLTHVPVANEQNATGAFPETDEHSLGIVGRSGLEPTNEYAAAADLVLAIGSTLGDLTTDNWELFDPSTTNLVHVTMRPRELDRHYVADVASLADPRSFLRDLTDAVEAAGAPTFDSVAAQARDRYEDAWADYFDPSENPAEEGVDPRLVVETVDRLADDYAVTTGGGVHTNWPRQLFADDLNDSFATPNFSGMSQGFPLALGAQLALDRTVITFEGDGGFAMVAQDLETAVREDIPVKVVVMNNHSFMSQRARQEQYYGGRYTGTTFSNPDFAAMARNFGMFGERVTPESDLDASVERLLETDGPGLLDVQIDPWIGVSGYDRD